MHLLNRAEFARAAGLNKSSVSRAIRAGHLPFDRATGKIDLDNDDVKTYAQSARFISVNHIPFNDRTTRHPSLSRPQPLPATASAAPPPAEPEPPAPASWPALVAAELDPHSPALLDAIDGLDDPHRIGFVDRSAVVNLVQALYSVLMLTPVDDTGLALDPYELARKVSGIFKDFLAFALESDIERILAEANTQLENTRAEIEGSAYGEDI